MAQISLRVDDDVKAGAEQTLSEIGLSMSAAINVFLKKVAREKRIPFELSVNSTDAVFDKAKNNADYLDMLHQSEEELKRGDTITLTLDELRAMEADDRKPTAKILEFEQKQGIQRRVVSEGSD